MESDSYSFNRGRRYGFIAVDENKEWDMPAHVRFVYLDIEGRHCTVFVCSCESATRDRNADAQLIASLLQKHEDDSNIDTCP